MIGQMAVERSKEIIALVKEEEMARTSHYGG